MVWLMVVGLLFIMSGVGIGLLVIDLIVVGVLGVFLLVKLIIEDFIDLSNLDSVLSKV